MSCRPILVPPPENRGLAVVVPLDTPVAVMLPAQRGPRGRDGTDGVSLSPDEGNQIESRPNGLFVPPPAWQSIDW